MGVEVAEQALRDFFTENNLEYTVEKVNKSNACVYKVSLLLQIEKKNKSSHEAQQEIAPTQAI